MEPTDFPGNPGSAGERILQTKYGTADRAARFYDRQMLPHLNERMIEFISQQELVFIATADGKGNCDCSLRSGLPGFVRILSQSTLAYPEYRGNGVLASLGNIYENPGIGMMFPDFFQNKIGLHVNGHAVIIENENAVHLPGIPDEMRQDIQSTGGRKSERWVLITVEEAYIHCSKHIPLLKKLDKPIPWGTDDAKLKGGDFFDVQRPPDSGENL
jgi:predicted pyridoxine 5'-phosphate oxidase superfamily flavin-nucleotide-binding protein